MIIQVLQIAILVGWFQANPKKQAGCEDEYDVVIVGGGMVGAAVGCGIGMQILLDSTFPKHLFRVFLGFQSLVALQLCVLGFGYREFSVDERLAGGHC